MTVRAYKGIDGAEVAVYEGPGGNYRVTSRLAAGRYLVERMADGEAVCIVGVYIDRAKAHRGARFLAEDQDVSLDFDNPRL